MTRNIIAVCIFLRNPNFSYISGTSVPKYEERCKVILHPNVPSTSDGPELERSFVYVCVLNIPYISDTLSRNISNFRIGIFDPSVAYASDDMYRNINTVCKGVFNPHVPDVSDTLPEALRTRCIFMFSPHIPYI